MTKRNHPHRHQVTLAGPYSTEQLANDAAGFILVHSQLPANTRDIRVEYVGGTKPYIVTATCWDVR